MSVAARWPSPAATACSEATPAGRVGVPSASWIVWVRGRSVLRSISTARPLSRPSGQTRTNARRPLGSTTSAAGRSADPMAPDLDLGGARLSLGVGDDEPHDGALPRGLGLEEEHEVVAGRGDAVDRELVRDRRACDDPLRVWIDDDDLARLDVAPVGRAHPLHDREEPVVAQPGERPHASSARPAVRGIDATRASCSRSISSTVARSDSAIASVVPSGDRAGPYRYPLSRSGRPTAASVRGSIRVRAVPARRSKRA